MTKKNIAEIRRRMKPDKNNIKYIRGCYVSASKEIVIPFKESLQLLPEDVAEKYLNVIGKALSGGLGRNLIPVDFPASQINGGENYALLSALKEHSIEDDGEAQKLYTKIIENYSSDEGFVILLTEEAYDIAFKSKNDEKVDDQSENVFRYILCAVCPMSITQSSLIFDSDEKGFRSSHPNTVIKKPDFGFMFPAFEGDGANVNGALLYTSDCGCDYSILADAVLGSEIPMPADTQKATFQSVLSDALEEECSYDVVEGVRDRICDIIAENAGNKTDEPSTVSKRTVEKVLRDCGVSEEKIDSFEKKYDESFGVGSDLLPENIVNAKRFEVRTPDVRIRVNPERKDLVDIRDIDGVKYVVIRADDSVEINGIPINIGREE